MIRLPEPEIAPRFRSGVIVNWHARTIAIEWTVVEMRDTPFGDHVIPVPEVRAETQVRHFVLNPGAFESEANAVLASFFEDAPGNHMREGKADDR